MKTIYGRKRDMMVISLIRKIGSIFAKIFRLIVWCHIALVLFGLFFGLFYSIIPPAVSSLQVYRTWLDGIRPLYPVRFVPLDQLNQHLPDMLMAAEDGNFPLHRGIDIDSMKEAWQINHQLGYYAAGASTITQQLSRTLFLFQKKWLVRKYAEVWLAITLELVMPKKRIIELYVNVVEWGPGIYGIDAAARHWFAKPATALGLDQLARLVAILPNPLAYTPHSFWRHPDLRWRWQYLWQRFAQAHPVQRPVQAQTRVPARLEPIREVSNSPAVSSATNPLPVVTAPVESQPETVDPKIDSVTP